MSDKLLSISRRLRSTPFTRRVEAAGVKAYTVYNHMLLPTEHTSIHVQAGEHEVEVTHEDRRWVFPREDCILLPVANTTTELLARYIGYELLDKLREQMGQLPTRMRIGVDENEGQWGFCDMEP